MEPRLVPVAWADVPWSELDSRPTRTVFQTRPWLSFLAESQDAVPIVAQVVRGPHLMGWFTGATVRRGGLRLLGSPLPGWTTSYMGFNLDDPADLPAALDALPRFAYRELGCVHVEVLDRTSTHLGVRPNGFRSHPFRGYQLRLDVDDDTLLSGMTANGRRDVRRALRNGIEVEVVDPDRDTDFAREHYSQVCEAFAKRSLVPTYPLSRVESMIRHLKGTDHLLLLRARTSGGEVAATGILPGLPGRTAFLWMAGSHRRHQALLPNEALMWHALRAWRDRGAVRLDFGGGGTYKAKYGGAPIEVRWLRRSRFAAIEAGREVARRMARRRLSFTGAPSSVAHPTR